MAVEQRVLVTGFEPWAEHAHNPAQQLAERVDGWGDHDLRVVGLVLPVARRAASDTVAAALRDLRPSAVLHLGLAAGRPAMTVERWAHNRADFVVPDNAGAQPCGEPLREDGSWRQPTSLDVAAAVRALRAAGVPAAASDSAGTFVCNAVLYATLDWAASHGYGGPIGFVHVPAAATLPLADQERALDRLLRLLARAPVARAPAVPSPAGIISKQPPSSLP